MISNGLKLESRIGVLDEGGTIKVTDEAIQVRGADAVDGSSRDLRAPLLNRLKDLIRRGVVPFRRKDVWAIDWPCDEKGI